MKPMSEELKERLPLSEISSGASKAVWETHSAMAKVLESGKAYPWITFSFAGWFEGPAEFFDTGEGKRLSEWHAALLPYVEEYLAHAESSQEEHYLDYGDGVNKGFVAGLSLGALSDVAWIKGETVEGVVRFVCGNGDTLWGFLSRFFSKNRKSHESVDAFSYGTVVGASAGPLLHAANFATWGASAVLNALYVSAYSNADNFAGGLFSLRHYVKERGLREGVRAFMGDTFQVANLGVVVAFFLMNVALYATVFSDGGPESMLFASVQSVLLNMDSVIATFAVRMSYERRKKKILSVISGKTS